MKWFIILAGIASNASANLLIKLALQPPFKIPTIATPLDLIRNWPLLLGVSLYGLAFVLYTAVLKFLPLNIAYPTLTSGAIASVTIMSVFVLGETFRPPMFLGLGLIILGVILLTSGSN